MKSNLFLSSFLSTREIVIFIGEHNQTINKHVSIYFVTNCYDAHTTNIETKIYLEDLQLDINNKLIIYDYGKNGNVDEINRYYK